ncbi:MAG: 5'/3'-nucleotidase SurE [Bacteroidetes bacterium]|nr:5'/3'-nucleotidase SurE [Bacteroidota bacterium]MCL6098808.1 5'/3'-nucleotidase SurE [Bacteroidota bacterium]
MKILISNDDGISSPGLNALAIELKKLGDVTIVAPVTEQSAVGHAITMKYPLRITDFYKNGDFFGYAVDGTPADCIKIGIRNIMHEPPDIVVSGINLGSNTAINIIYSGTVSAAREAAIMDVPSIAVSVTSHEAKDFSFAAKFSSRLAQMVAKNKMPAGTLLNVNIPDLPEDQISGVLLTQQGKSKWDDVYEERKDPYGQKYYWLTGNLVQHDTTLETDQFAIRKNYVSVTPIHFDLTDYKTYDTMKSWQLENLFKQKS